MQWYSVGLSIAAILITLAFIITTWRIIIGPNSLDRLVGMDGLVAMMQSALAVYMCWSLNTTVVNAMMVIALLGFISTVAVTRFRRKDTQ